MEYREEHKREALIGTVVFHALLAAFFIFTIFKGPDPPLTEIGGGGVELNYGIDEAGSGDIQSMAPANESKNREDSRPPAARPDPTPQPARTAAEPEPQPAAQEKIVTSEAEESPVKIPPVETAAPPRPEPVRETPKPAEKPRTLYTPKGSTAGGGNGQNGTSNTPTGNNNGDKPGSVGDQGDPNGSLDAKALYGKPGSGGGSGGGMGNLNMPGWAFDNQPREQDPSNESGKVVLKIKINEDGEVESVTVQSSSLSPTVTNFYKDLIYRKATFRRVGSGSGGGTGFITYIIGAK
ncbi:hypothetical protein PK28_10050 [Hymenobacter sp. DG25B]|uniref:hypothetical protein n=1 Tax=Hymenobacter sp. DG25B TaxID=1385664 RepID=UPI000540AE92|nr:hypothetical protein [Hymenobacter sp. DG25B]AIZ63942.1 hypothetical protein PK28_10050 [Hymenobacter sp. DG25B]